MSRIAVHVVAGLLFVGVGTPDAQESIQDRQSLRRERTTRPVHVFPFNSIAPPVSKGMWV